MRKFISLLSAAAVAATVVVVPITASAEDAVLYSDSFNGYPTSVATGDGEVFAASEPSQAHIDAGSFQWMINSPQTREIGELAASVTGAGDDTALIMIKEKEDATDKYMSLSQNRFPGRGATQLTGFENYTANDGESLVIAFKAMLTEGELTDGSKTTTQLNLGGLGVLSSTELGTGEWKEVKLVTSEGSTAIYVEGAQVGDAVAAVPSSIGPVSFDGNTKCNVYSSVCIDELVILSSADGVNAVIPAAEDQEIKVVEPDPTPEPAAEITKTTMIDFDTTDFEAAGITVTNHKDYTNVEAAAVDGGVGDNTSIVYKVDQTSSKNTAYGYATIDFSALTSGKSHVVIDYDIYVGSSGRLKVIFGEGALSGSQGDSIGSLFTQGITKGGDTGTNCKADTWVHTTVDVDLASGTGTYSVTGPEETAVGSGKFTTDMAALTTMSLVSWSPNTSYLDNIAIGTGGETEVVIPTPIPTVSPEPYNANVDGSDQNLVPDGAYEFADAFAGVNGEEAVVLNHSAANKAVEGSIVVYDDKNKATNKSTFITFDVLVNVGDAITLSTGGNSKTGPSYTLTGNEDGTVSVTYVNDGKGAKSISSDLVCGTWYRVNIELKGDDNAYVTSTILNIYRINYNDPSKADAAAVSAEIGPRTLNEGVFNKASLAVIGTPYIDNGTVYLYSEKVKPTPEPYNAEVDGSNRNLVPEGAHELTDAFAAVNGDAAVMLNHSAANKAVEGSIVVYDDKNKATNKSTFITFDVLVNAGDVVTLSTAGNSKTGPSYTLTGNEDGTVSVTYVNDGKGAKSISSDLVCGTWYRVQIEFKGDDNAFVTGTVLNIYRINYDDPSKVDAAAVSAEIGPRTLNEGVFNKASLAVTGTPYIDNGAVYLYSVVWYKYTVTYNDDNTVSVQREKVGDPASVDTSGNTETSKVFVWNQNLQPYKKAE